MPPFTQSRCSVYKSLSFGSGRPLLSAKPYLGEGGVQTFSLQQEVLRLTGMKGGWENGPECGNERSPTHICNASSLSWTCAPSKPTLPHAFLQAPFCTNKHSLKPLPSSWMSLSPISLTFPQIPSKGPDRSRSAPLPHLQWQMPTFSCQHCVYLLCFTSNFKPFPNICLNSKAGFPGSSPPASYPRALLDARVAVEWPGPALLPASRRGSAGGPVRCAHGPPRTGSAGTPSPGGRAAQLWRMCGSVWAGPGPGPWAGQFLGWFLWHLQGLWQEAS